LPLVLVNIYHPPSIGPKVSVIKLIYLIIKSLLVVFSLGGTPEGKYRLVVKKNSWQSLKRKLKQITKIYMRRGGEKA